MRSNHAAAAFFAFALLAPVGALAQDGATPLALVDPFVGTSGTPQGGPIDTFPGADVPFGMVQWSPDTPSQNAGGGYEYGDTEITGFSLTHVSGPGCSVFGDFGILPVVGDATDPAHAKQPFSHADENASPGWYAVTLGKGPSAIRSELTVAARSGIGTFTFPPAANATLLFNASSNQAGVTNASVRVDSPQQLSGSASSGFFCGMPDRYTVYFVARFDRPMSAHGTWKGAAVHAGSSREDGAGSGAWATFDTRTAPAVHVKVGLSFVSVAGAIANLEAEQRSWDPAPVRAAAERQWSDVLARVQITGGTPAQRRTFYTALYHAFLHPNLFSDVDGRYAGFDDAVHRVRAGHAEYANFSDWDIYRTEVPLLALLAPAPASDMMQSLVDAYHQEGWLPRWALANGPTSVMGGDSVDPVIAGAYAFGARDFDLAGALRGMVKGASTTSGPPGQGWYVERWELDDDYLHRGYVANTHTTSVAPVPNGASETLEYALDDFSIARFARATGHDALARTFAARSANWSTLFDTSTGWAAGRDPSGAFMHAASGENGQSGFQEGNAAQYTWMVPQDLAGLIRGMGGNAAALAKLDAFFSEINAGQEKPNAWLGNEVSLGSPWVYLSAGAPWRAQDIVRKAIATLYDDKPDGIPGNDDLGTMSAWYVWCALGLYPQNPAVRALDIGSPLFTHAVVSAPGGPRIEIDAPNAATDAPYVDALRVDGKASERTWVALPLHGTLRLDFDLASSPNRTWGSSPADAPPSYAPGTVRFPPSTAAVLAAPTRALSIGAGRSADFAFSIDNTRGGAAERVTWQVGPVPHGVTVDVPGGAAAVAAGSAAAERIRITADASAGTGYYDVPVTGRAANGAAIERLVAIVRVTNPSVPAHVVAYAQNRFGNTIEPLDLTTGAVGPEIPAGEEPRDAAFSPDRRRLYVTDRGGNTVTVLDTSTDAVVASVKTGHAPSGVAVAPDGTVWFVNGDDGTIQSIDPATLTASAPIPVGPNPRAVAVAPDGSRLYATVGGANVVVPLEIASRVLLAPISTGMRPAGIALTPDGTRAYVADTASNEVTPIDLRAMRALPPIPVGVSPMLVAISPNGRVAYASNYGNSTVTAIDVTSNRSLGPVLAGGAPYGIAFTPDGKTAAVIARRDNACVLIDVASGRASAPILLGNGPYTIAVP